MKKLTLLIFIILISSISYAEYKDRYRYIKQQVSKKDNSIILLLSGSIITLYGYSWEEPIKKARARNDSSGVRGGEMIRDELYGLSILCFSYYGYLKFGLPYFRFYPTYEKLGMGIFKEF